MKYCYSLTGEKYSGELDTIGEAVAACWNNYEDEIIDNGQTIIYVGEAKRAIDYLRESASWIGEYTVDYLEDKLADEITSDYQIMDINKEDIEKLGDLIVDFLAQKAVFTRYGVDNVITVDISDTVLQATGRIAS
jgi:hypothetical protein